ncbi:DUF4267 domain-containing protein [Leifsonia sp. NPDC058292]|uniref:DUF4267 domain-containing protein n=1 Tax=Leifsonia sp. NPDC058292 TaxID=3346428 RepID=UPI0036DABC7C
MDFTQFTSATWIGAGLAVLLALGFLYIGASFVIAPESASRGFGFTSAFTAEVTPWLHVKGPRDIVSGLLVAVMLLVAGPAACATVLLVEALIPLGDAAMIFRHHGRAAAAFGIHVATAAAMIIAAILLLV